ncbi:MAG: hypothetical protein ABSF64_28630 [Bryobacteraceae bacterium]
MSASDKIADRLIAGFQVAGVLATGWFVWTYNILPRLGLQSLAGIAAEALFYVTLAWICGAVTTFLVYFVIALADLPGAARFSLRTSAPAMWFAPAIVLLSTRFAAAFPVSLLLIANATRQLISQWGIIASPIHRREAARTEPTPMFSTASPEAVYSWTSAPFLMGSLLAQAGLVAMLWGHPFRAAAFFAISTAILTSLSIATGAYLPGKTPALPHSALSVVMAFLLAATVTFGGIAVRGGGGRGSGADSSSSGGGGGSATQQDKDLPENPDENVGFGGDFPGVILLPELKPYTTLFVPVLASPAKFGAPIAKAVDIPFSGQYWMFRFPAPRPPRRSIIRRGSASELSFHTTDGWPMEMEAHQKLEQPVSTRCCSQIQIAIRNTDPYPGTVSLELILIDTSMPMNPGHSLGNVTAGSPSPAERVLSFRLPPAMELLKFDELKVVFHRDRMRAEKSARIAIERFMLAP